MKKILLLHNIATSYYKNIVFNEFFKIHNNFKVIHLGETENIRDWKIDLSDINYPFEILTKGSINNYSKYFFIKNTWRVLTAERPDIVYIGGYFHIAYWTALLWSKINNVKIMLEMDSNKFDHDRKYWKESIKSFFVKKCDFGLTYGELSKNYFIEQGMAKEKIVIKPNVSSSSLFYKANDLHKPHSMTHEKYFIYVGRFSEEKNLKLLIECFYKAKHKVSDTLWGLLLIGSGPKESELLQLVQQLETKDIVFPGFVDKNDLRNFYNHANVFILPSTREPWGLVANEAMMCGLPVVISNKCGCSLDLVKENGYLFDPYNEVELVEILFDYMQNSIDMIMQSKKSLDIIKNFTPELASKRIYEALMLLTRTK